MEELQEEKKHSVITDSEEPVDIDRDNSEEREKLSQEQTGKRFHSMQKWSIIAAILLIIGLSVFFFLSGKVNVGGETTILEDHADSIISKYTKDSLQYIRGSLLLAEQIPDNAPDTKLVVPIEKSQPAVPREETMEYEENQNVIQNEEDAFEELYYTLSNNEIQTFLSDDYKPEEAERTINTANLDLNQIPKPAKGNKEYNDYIEKNRNQLANADCENQHGKVILLFNVNKQGRPIDIVILRSLCPTADREAIRLLQDGPDWTVGNPIARLEITF